MKVICKETAAREAQEVFDILLETVGNLPEHLMKSELWANSVVYAMMNLLAKIARQGASKEEILEAFSEVWDGESSDPRPPGN